MLPELPAKAAYILINNPARRNALCLATLRDLRDQLTRALTSPLTGRPLLLPPFRPQLLPAFERAAGLPPKPWPEGPDSTAKKRKKRKKKMQKQAPNTTTTTTTTDEDDDLTWLVDPAAWNHHRDGLPSVLVLRSSVPSSRVFSSGHDLRELSTLSPDDVRATFALCADVMSLLRRSPAPVVCAVEGLATAAGMQLALTADLVVARGRRLRGVDEDPAAAARFQLPGARLGLPCTSPATAVARRLPPAVALRMLMTAEPVPAEQLAEWCGAAVEAVGGGRGGRAFEARVALTVARLAGAAAQPAALAKWAFWTQVGMGDGGGGGYEGAARWAGRVMAVHATSAEAREGVAAFLDKRSPAWVS
ncbi:hypothetical protein RB597_007699 [Gaeumannomyces tritici]